MSREAQHDSGMPDTAADTYESETDNHLMSGLFFTVVILGLLGFAGMKVLDPSTLPIRSVSVAGNFEHLSPSSLQQRVGDVVRGGFFNVNVDTIQQVLLQEPWIREVSVKRIWPDRITVNIREQTAVARWSDNGLLNSASEIFYPAPETFPESLPVVSGPENTTILVMENLEKIQQILPVGLSLQQLHLSERRSWELKLTNGPVIRLGKTDILNRMTRLLEYFPVDQLEVAGNIEYIDMRYTNGFAIRWQDQNKVGLQRRQENYGKKI
jgi:cell division protein FtsQ